MTPRFSSDIGAMIVAPSYPSRRHNGSPALHLMGTLAPRNSEGREHGKGDRQSGQGALACPASPEGKRGQVRGYAGNELTLAQQSVHNPDEVSAFPFRNDFSAAQAPAAAG